MVPMKNYLDDKRIILASALTYLSNLTNTTTFLTTRDAVLTGYILENLNRIDIEKSSIKTWIISNEGHTPFAPRSLRSYRLEFRHFYEKFNLNFSDVEDEIKRINMSKNFRKMGSSSKLTKRAAMISK